MAVLPFFGCGPLDPDLISRVVPTPDVGIVDPAGRLPLGWSNWEVVDKGVLVPGSTPAVVSLDGQADYFMRSPSGSNVEHKWFDSKSWHSDLDDEHLVDDGVSALVYRRQFYVFFLEASSRNLVYQIYKGNSRVGGSVLAAPSTGLQFTPAASVNLVSGIVDRFKGPDSFDVFAVDRTPNRRLMQLTINATTGVAGEWTPVPGVEDVAAAPSAVSWGNRRIDVVYLDSSRTVNHAYWDGAWHLGDPIIGPATGAPAIASVGSGRLDVFAGLGDGLYHAFGNGTTWSRGDRAWVKRTECIAEKPGYIGSTSLLVASAPSAYGSPLEHLDVAVIGRDENLWHDTYGILPIFDPAAPAPPCSCKYEGETCGKSRVCGPGISPACVGCGALDAACCAGKACDPGGTCDSSNTCRKCGASGETCCDGGVCEAGTTCDDRNRCACGLNLGDVCCADGSCSGGNFCSGGSCQPPATFSSLYSGLLKPRCSYCHGLDSTHYPTAPKFIDTRGVPEAVGATWSNLVGVSSAEATTLGKHLARVEKKRPDLSYLYLKITADPTITGDPMPVGSKALVPSELDQFRSWILDDAKNN